MKIRKGFISNSSSTSFVLSLSSLSKATQDKIDKLTERSDDMSRRTGKITNIDKWLALFDDNWSVSEEKKIKSLMKKHKDIVIIRESDEEMGGSFEDVGLVSDDFVNDVLLEFEYH